MPYFLRHYEKIADKIFVYDNYSTDNTPKIVDAHPKTERVLYGDPKNHYNSKLIKMKNEEYKKSRGKADWVMIVDIDEILHHEEILKVLENYKSWGFTFPKTQGYDMVGDDYPKGNGQIYEEIKEGFTQNFYSKRAVFNPDIDINYVVGAHRCFPKGKLVDYTDNRFDIKLLHYRFLCEDFFTKNMLRRMSRISEEDIKNCWGALKLPDGVTIGQWSSEQYNKAKLARKKVPGL
jgi:glycosyltransferase involved in cell wall biosynthesis